MFGSEEEEKKKKKLKQRIKKSIFIFISAMTTIFCTSSIKPSAEFHPFK